MYVLFFLYYYYLQIPSPFLILLLAFYLLVAFVTKIIEDDLPQVLPEGDIKRNVSYILNTYLRKSLILYFPLNLKTLKILFFSFLRVRMEPTKVTFTGARLCRCATSLTFIDVLTS